MTNQASEDELDKILEDVYYSGYSDGKDSESGYGRAVDADSRPIAKSAIQSLIRTEKLKLLAEVRERVVMQEYPEDAVLWTPDGNERTRVIKTEDAIAVLAKLEAEL